MLETIGLCRSPTANGEELGFPSAGNSVLFRFVDVGRGGEEIDGSSRTPKQEEQKDEVEYALTETSLFPSSSRAEPDSHGIGEIQFTVLPCKIPGELVESKGQRGSTGKGITPRVSEFEEEVRAFGMLPVSL
jgi:hypothetical protein